MRKDLIWVYHRGINQFCRQAYFQGGFMQTLSLDQMATDTPPVNEHRTYFAGFWVDRIEEFNLLDFDGKITRTFRIHWKGYDGHGMFDCILGSKVYKRTVIPNRMKVVEMGSEQKQPK
jgi:hypothetical protein